MVSEEVRHFTLKDQVKKLELVSGFYLEGMFELTMINERGSPVMILITEKTESYEARLRQEPSDEAESEPNAVEGEAQHSAEHHAD